jgi:hypothetical protein
LQNKKDDAKKEIKSDFRESLLLAILEYSNSDDMFNEKKEDMVIFMFLIGLP